MSEVNIVGWYDERSGSGNWDFQPKTLLPEAVPTVLKSDFDAQRLRADTAEAENRDLRLQCGGMQMDLDEAKEKLAADEQRIAELVDLLTDAYGAIDENDGWKQLCTRILAVIQPTESGAIAALNPNPEAGSHEKH